MKDQFRFDLWVDKAETREGRHFVTLYATDTASDREGDRCSVEGLERMVTKIRAGGVDLLNTHHEAIGFGTAVDGHIVDAAQFHPELGGHKALMVDVELDFEFPQAKTLFEAAQSGSSKYKFSIGGKLNRKNPRCVTYDRGHRVFNDLDIDHLTAARVGREANSRTHIAASVMKTLGLTDKDWSDVQGRQAPYTVRDIALQFGLPVRDEVQKEIQTAFFTGETEESGDPEHSHGFTARLSGRSGTLIGMTTSWSAGERHAHLIDLQDNEQTNTSGSSRGDTHEHALGMGNVREITRETFEETVAKVDPAALKLLEEDMDKESNSVEEEEQQKPTTPSVPAIEAASSTEVEVQTAPASEAVPTGGLVLTKAEAGLWDGFKRTIKSVMGTSPEGIPSELGEFAKQIHSDFAAKGGDIDELAKSTVALMQAVAGIQFEHDDLSVRTAKLFEVIQSAGMLKPLEVPVILEASQSETLKTDDSTTDEEEEGGESVATKMSPEQDDTEKTETSEQDKAVAKTSTAETDEQESGEMTPKQIDALKTAIVTDVLDTFRKEGLLPKAAAGDEGDGGSETSESDVDASASATETDAEGSDTDGDQKTTEEDTTEEDSAEAKTEAAVLTKVADALDGLNDKLDGIGERVSTLETTPGQSRRLTGQDSIPGAKEGVFTGVLGSAVPMAKRAAGQSGT